MDAMRWNKMWCKGENERQSTKKNAYAIFLPMDGIAYIRTKRQMFAKAQNKTMLKYGRKSWSRARARICVSANEYVWRRWEKVQECPEVNCSSENQVKWENENERVFLHNW